MEYGLPYLLGSASVIRYLPVGSGVPRLSPAILRSRPPVSRGRIGLSRRHVRTSVAGHCHGNLSQARSGPTLAGLRPRQSQFSTAPPPRPGRSGAYGGNEMAVDQPS